MFNSKRSKIVALLALLIVGGLSALFMFLQFIGIGPGLPPPAGMPQWYIPGYDIRIENETIVEDRRVAEHFTLMGDRIMKCPSYFPPVSKYCSYANYTRTGSDDRYVIAAWYFDDSKKFLQAQKELYQYLKEHGRVSAMEFDIYEEIKRLGKEERYRPKTFNATLYESEKTSGYFLVYNKPFSGERDDYFIVYYGLMGSVDLSFQTPLLKELIAEGYYLNEPGTVGELLL